MFSTLIESRAVAPRRAGGSLASIIFHGAVITAGVLATARDIIPVAPVPLVTHIVHFNRPIDPQPVSNRATTSSASAVSTLPVFRLNAPLTIPVGLPPVDLNAGPITEYAPGPIGPIGCQDCIVGRPHEGDQAQWSATDVMMQLREKPVPPRYPEALRRAGVEGDVVVRFLVDTTGRIDMRSVEVVDAAHDAFAAAVRETLAKMRFSPSTTGERKVPALAVMPFRFRLR
jgi:periplasmic protein TonB